MAVELTLESIFVFLVFVVVIFVSYKLFKFFVRLTLITVAGFLFPWVANFIGIPLVTNIETAITFACIGLILFLIYEFYHVGVQFFKKVSNLVKKNKSKK